MNQLLSPSLTNGGVIFKFGYLIGEYVPRLTGSGCNWYLYGISHNNLYEHTVISILFPIVACMTDFYSIYGHEDFFNNAMSDLWFFLWPIFRVINYSEKQLETNLKYLIDSRLKQKGHPIIKPGHLEPITQYPVPSMSDIILFKRESVRHFLRLYFANYVIILYVAQLGRCASEE